MFKKFLDYQATGYRNSNDMFVGGRPVEPQPKLRPPSCHHRQPTNPCSVWADFLFVPMQKVVDQLLERCTVTVFHHMYFTQRSKVQVKPNIPQDLQIFIRNLQERPFVLSLLLHFNALSCAAGLHATCSVLPSSDQKHSLLHRLPQTLILTQSTDAQTGPLLFRSDISLTETDISALSICFFGGEIFKKSTY